MSNASVSQTILAVDDNADALYALERILSHNGYSVVTASSGAEAYERAIATSPSLILMDVMMPEGDGCQITRRLKSHPDLRFIPVILVTAKDSLQDVITGLDSGADDYLSKPFRPEELLARLRAAIRLRKLYQNLKVSEQQNKKLLSELSSCYDFDNIVGKSLAMQEVFSLVRKVLPVDSPVLVTGPTGAGKELIAKAIHYNSPRKLSALVAQNCAAFNENLLESELFGHVRGAFTGALKDKKGLFEAADGGTLFLDEIGEMSPTLQAKLLRVLQDGIFLPVGSTVERKVDVRVIAATNRDLLAMVEQERFREDLYYRLNVITIKLPSLAQRRTDIPLLIEYFLEKSQSSKGFEKKTISPRAVELLSRYCWKGNVRELGNEIERMLILCGENDELDIDVISSRIRDEVTESYESSGGQSGVLKVAVESLERDLIQKTLQRVNWNKSSAAKELGVSRSSLISKVKLYGLSKV